MSRPTARNRICPARAAVVLAVLTASCASTVTPRPPRLPTPDPITQEQLQLRVYMDEVTAELQKAKAETEASQRAREQERMIHAEQLARLRGEEKTKRQILAKERPDLVAGGAPDTEELKTELATKERELAELRRMLGATQRSGQEAKQEPEAAVSPEVPVSPGVPTTNAERLQKIASERASIQPTKNYRVGPGDLVEVTVFDLPEMTRKLRVSTAGFIQLPLIGAVKAAGMTQEELATDIAARLSTNYLQDPQVDVVVEGYESQQVAVTGAVVKPGLYPLTRQRYTILDMISQAGGLASNSGAMIQFIPATEGMPSSAFAAANAGALPPLGSTGDADSVTNDAVSIDLNDLLRGGNRAALNFAVLAGDVIFVPEAGTFTIEGWIDKPGTYPLNRTTTVLAALSIGGGGLFPTRLKGVQILRNNEGSSAGRDVKVADLNAIRAGTIPDVELRSGDIVHVPANPLLVPFWGVFTFIKSLVTIGGSIPLF